MNVNKFGKEYTGQRRFKYQMQQINSKMQKIF